MAKKRLKKKVKFVLFIILVLLFSTVSVMFFNIDIKDNFDVKNKIIKPKEVWPKVSKISLVATGDGLLHNVVYLDAYDRSTKTFNFAPQLI